MATITEGHCRYITQLCNPDELRKLFEENALYIPDWEEELKKEIEYRQGLQIQLAQNIIESELSTRTTENKVKELKEELKVRDENIAKVIEEGKEGDKVLKENFSGMIIPVVKGLGLS